MIKKHLIFLFIGLVTYNALAQSKKEIEKQAELKSLIWGETDAYNDAMDTPEKWLNESAAYLVKSIKYYYNRPGNSIEYTKIERNRIKLLDQAAVKDYSEFKFKDDNAYFRNGSRVTNTFLLGFKIVKPDGKEIEIDVSEEVVNTDGENKIAIPSLEKGDIIDYYFYSNTIVGENDLYQYKSIENVIGASYPIANYEFALETEDDFFVSFNTFNGAPKLEQAVVPTKKDKRRMYEFRVQNVERNDFPRWFYPLVELPSYKFQILFARSGKYEKRAYAFISEESNLIKTGVSKEEIFSLYEDKFKPYGDLGDVERFLKKKEFASNEEKVKAVFYYIRHAYYTNYVEAIVLDEADIMYPYELYGRRPIVFNKDEEFVKFFCAFLKDNKIDYDIVIGTKRYNGNIKNLLLENNIDFVLKINTENPVYIEGFGPYVTVNQIAPQLENTDAYALKVVDRKKITDVETIKLPISTFKENSSKEKLELTISPDFLQVGVSRNSTYIGQNKNREQESQLKYYDYVYEDHTKYETTPILDRVRNKKDKAKYKIEYAALIQKLRDKQLERSKARASNEFDVELSDYSIEIVSNGRFGKADAMEYKEVFSVADDMIKNAGKNYIFDVGKFLGGQIDLTEEQKERTSNIYMSYPRSFNYEITLNIPEGYTVSGVENLSKSVENSTGGFNSNAVIEGNKLVIKAEKYYKNYYEPNSNWSQMVAFLDAAFQFTQSKILLKKS